MTDAEKIQKLKQALETALTLWCDADAHWMSEFSHIDFTTHEPDDPNYQAFWKLIKDV